MVFQHQFHQVFSNEFLKHSHIIVLIYRIFKLNTVINSYHFMGNELKVYFIIIVLVGIARITLIDESNVKSQLALEALTTMVNQGEHSWEEWLI